MLKDLYIRQQLLRELHCDLPEIRTVVTLPSDSEAAFQTVGASCSGVGYTDNDIVQETQMQKHEKFFHLNLDKMATHTGV